MGAKKKEDLRGKLGYSLFYWINVTMFFASLYKGGKSRYVCDGYRVVAAAAVIIVVAI